MSKNKIHVDCSKIVDWETFHDEFQEKMGFFDGYGRNMNAWIDCMGDMYTNGEYESLSKFSLNDGDIFTLILNQSEGFIENHLDIFSGLCECISFVNNQDENISLNCSFPA